ncbi:MAG: hypothetical protein QM534_09170 [Sediminibacterium sp.]|nr:hypothetical protein [Sediminibacterium sp.]
MKKALYILFILFGIVLTTPIVAQTGGRKKEHRNQRRGGFKLFKGRKSKGNADAFARSSRKRGFFARIFNRGGSSTGWAYRSTKMSRKQRTEDRHVFKRYRTRGKKSNFSILSRQNRDRDRRRVRGVKVFHKKKHL